MDVRVVVHGLLHGQPLCGFSTDVPALWPKEHMWVDFDDLAHITCPGCNAEAKRIMKTPSAP